jgi:hypothetical protein
MEMSRTPRLSAFMGHILSACIAAVLVVVILAIGAKAPGQGKVFVLGFALIAAWVLFSQLYVLVAARCTRYTISRGYLLIEHGVISKKYPIFELLHLKDNAEVRQGLLQRFTGDGSLRLTFEQHQKPVVLVGVAPFSDLMQFRGDLLDLARLLRGVTGLIA